jgi:hypothetical protein
MRTILVLLWIVLLAVPAQAQRSHGKRNADSGQAQSADAKKKKASEEEKAAKAALSKLPDKPYDPWGKMR